MPNEDTTSTPAEEHAVATAAGILLTDEIITALGPVLNDKPLKMVIESLAAGFMTAVMTANTTAEIQACILDLYAERISCFATVIRSGLMRD